MDYDSYSEFVVNSLFGLFDLFDGRKSRLGIFTRMTNRERCIKDDAQDVLDALGGYTDQDRDH